MTPLPAEPKIIVWIENGELQGIATNVSPDLNVIRVNNKIDYREYAAGLPFEDSRTNYFPES